MNRKLIWTLAAAIAGAGAVFLVVTRGSPASRRAAESATPLFTVSRGPLTISVTESGTIQNREQMIVKSEVEGRATILSLVEEGTFVKKGERNSGALRINWNGRPSSLTKIS